MVLLCICYPRKNPLPKWFKELIIEICCLSQNTFRSLNTWTFCRAGSEKHGSANSPFFPPGRGCGQTTCSRAERAQVPRPDRGSMWHAQCFGIRPWFQRVAGSEGECRNGFVTSPRIPVFAWLQLGVNVNKKANTTDN